MIAALVAAALAGASATGNIIEVYSPASKISCATWLSSSEFENTYSFWIGGYWSGMNFKNPKNHIVGRSTDKEGIIEEVKLVCRAEPSVRVMEAVTRVYLRMEREGR